MLPRFLLVVDGNDVDDAVSDSDDSILQVLSGVIMRVADDWPSLKDHRWYTRHSK